MRLLIYGINFSPELTGIGKYTGELAEYLVEHGHEVRVVTAPPYYPQWQIGKGYSKWHLTREVSKGMQVFRCPIWVPRKPTGARRLLHLASFALSSLPILLAQAAWKPDLIFTIAPTLFSAPFALAAGRMARCKTWLHIQDFELDAAFNLGILCGSNRVVSMACKIEQAIFRKFDRVSTISTRMLERLKQKGVSSKKTVLFPNWVDTDKICPVRSAGSLRKQLNFSKDQVVILYSGNMGKKQGTEILIEAAQRLKDDPRVQFMLCGDGVAREDLELRAAGMQNVHFLPLQPIEQLNDLLNTGDIHVLPQRADAADLVMPSKLTGMLASGRAVIATAAQGTELARVIDQVGILVPPENPDRLAASLLSLVQDPITRERLGKLGRNYAVENWSRDEVLKKFTQQVQKMVSNERNEKKYQGFWKFWPRSIR